MVGLIMIKQTILGLLIAPMIANAGTQEELTYLQKEGLPLPNDGITLVDKSELKMPDFVIEKHKAERKQLLKLGYVREDSIRAKELLNFSKTAQDEFQRQSFQRDINTGLRRSALNIRFAYTFIDVPQALIKDRIGIAPVGAFIPDQGWTGGVSFFSTDFGVCAYTEKNLLLSGGSSRINKDIVKYDINGKITLSDVRGTDATGYLYQTTWLDKDFERTLECAAEKYSKDTMPKVTALAKRIDAQ